MRVFPLVIGVVVGALASACGSSSTPVTGLKISELAIYQGVKVSVMTGGQVVTNLSSQLVMGRDAMLRVFVTPDAGWKGREVKGVLKLTAGSTGLAGIVGSMGAQGFPPIEAKATINGPSTDGDLNSTLTFDIPGDRIQAEFQYSVALFEATSNAPILGTKEGSFFPAMGSAKLVATDAGPSVKIKLVPMRYTADGSNRMPDVSDVQLAVFRNLMRETYPTPKIEISVREPVDLGTRLTAGGGWSQALDQLLRLRSADAPTPNIYYYGVFAPADSFGTYCSGGCITGLSSGTRDPDNASLRASIGLGFGGSQADSSAGTFVHEVGHAHGRSHSPCGGADGPDRAYPYRGGVTGSWGYSIVDKRLRDPNATKDFMGYCDPIWVSDFTYNALLDRIAHVNFLPVGQLLTATQTQAFRIVHHTDEGLMIGSVVELEAAPRGEPVDVELLDADGQQAGMVTGQFLPFDHLSGGFVYVREADLSGHVRLGLGGRTVRVPEHLRSVPSR